MKLLLSGNKWLAPTLLVGLLATGCSSDSDSKLGDGGSAAESGDGGSGAVLTVSGPVTGGKGKPFTASTIDLGPKGYLEEEFFLAGNATAYALVGGMTMDGNWTANETTKADFKTRLLVRRPSDAAKFNGTVIIEWLNVSAGADGDPGWAYNWEEIVREGYVHIGLSAQQVGVQGGGVSLQANPPAPLTKYDAERYGSLNHPGDTYSYDIFTQAARIVRDPAQVDILGGLKPKHIIAYGESQSAFRMVSYVNAVQPLQKAYDGFFIHSRSSGGTPLDDSGGIFAMLIMSTALIRTDLDVPVFQFQTETDVFGQLGFYSARQPDTDRLRTWEVAGTAHADAHIAGAAAAGGMDLGCGMVNDGPQHFVIKAALHSLNRWLTDGTKPASAEPLKADETGKKGAKDARGNTLGGIRTPHVDVPISVLSGDGASGGGPFCGLFGSTTPFTPELLKELYPTHQEYVDKVKASAATTRNGGFMLPPEEATIVAEAQAAAVPPQ